MIPALGRQRQTGLCESSLVYKAGPGQPGYTEKPCLKGSYITPQSPGLGKLTWSGACLACGKLWLLPQYSPETGMAAYSCNPRLQGHRLKNALTHTDVRSGWNRERKQWPNTRGPGKASQPPSSTQHPRSSCKDDSVYRSKHILLKNF